MNNLHLNLLFTGVTIIVVMALDFIGERFIKKTIKDRRKSIKIRVFYRYILAFIVLFSMAKIWVEGFGYFLTFIGIIAAALTITQKEYLMNFVGWLIIMWRELFVEGDHIEIGRYMGFVVNMGPLFFTLEEANDSGDRTGKLIKIPNSMTATHALHNYHFEHAFVEGKAQYVFSVNTPSEKIKKLASDLQNEVESIITSLYGNGVDTNKLSKPQCVLRVQQEIPIGLRLRIRYLSRRQDQKMIENNIFALVMKTIDENDDVNLSTAC